VAINLPSGFNILNIDPIDSRFVVADQSELLGFSAANVYEGLLVYQTDNNTLFVLTDIANYNSIIGWEIVGGGSTDISSLNTFTGSAQTSLTALNSATSSYLTSASTGSFILVSQTSSMSVLSALTASFISSTFISASAAASGFGSGGGSVPSGTISGSTQIAELGFVNSTQTSSMSVLSSLTASFISSTFISASAAASGFGTTLFPSGLLSSSFQIATDISGAFTSLSSSFQSRINSLEVGGGSSIFTLTGSFYSTTNNIQITGSLSVGSGSFKSFEVNSDGFVVLGDMNKDLNNAPIGTIAYSGSSFYLIS
jgi:hypothetical protein